MPRSDHKDPYCSFNRAARDRHLGFRASGGYGRIVQGRRGEDCASFFWRRDVTIPTTSRLRVEVTASFLAENAAKQRAYEARRRVWTAGFRPSDPRAQPVAQSRARRGKIHDARQGKLAL